VQQVGNSQGEAVNKLLTDVLGNFTQQMSTGVEKRCFLGVKARFESFGVSGIFIKWPLPGRRRPPPVMHVFMHNPL
jgi:hypothetical protein